MNEMRNPQCCVSAMRPDFANMLDQVIPRTEHFGCSNCILPHL